MERQSIVECHICGKKLSRKQRLETHLQSVHGVQGDREPKRYMLYKKDVSIPIPDRTKYRHKLQSSTVTSNVDMPSTSHDTSTTVEDPNFSTPPEPESASFTDSSLSSALNISAASCMEMEKATTEFPEDNRSEFEKSFTEENPPQFDEDIPGTSENIHYQKDLVDAQDITDKPLNFSSDEESEDSVYSSLSSDSEDGDSSLDSEVSETEEQDVPTLTKCDESCLLTLSFIMKHHLSGQASSDLLTLLKLLGKSEHQMSDMSLKKLKEVVGSCDADVIHFCEKCFTIFPEDLDVYKCTQDGCPGLRYKGSERNQVKKQKKSFFTSLSVTRQIKNLLEREGVWEAVVNYRRKCSEENFISDILNAEVCKDLQSKGNFLDSENNLSLIFNTDGIPLYQSSGISLWPVYLAINELPPSMRFSRKNMILWGVWQARGKPVFQTFFQPFIKHMVQLKERGVVWNYHGQEICSKAILLLGTVDLQAKAYLAEMTMYNGRHGCITCEDEGEVVKQGKGHTRVYSFKNVHERTIRTTTGLLQKGLLSMESGNVEMGIKGVSPLLGLDWFDMVHGMVPDYMHGLLLGVTKKLLSLLFSPSNSSKPYFVGKNIKSTDKILKNMKPTDQISRLPRKVEKNLHHFKASELQMWLLYYSIPSLINFLPQEYLQHLGLLVEASYLLLSDKITDRDLHRADYVLAEFYREFANLYGTNNCTLNVHNVGCHLTMYVRKFGPLWAWSCFQFEDMNGFILDSVHGTGDVCLQIMWMVQAQKRLSVDASHISNPSFKTFVEEMMNSSRKTVTIKQRAENCLIAGGITDISVENLRLENDIRALLDIEGDLGRLSKALRIVRGDVVFYSEHYSRMKKRIAYVVTTDPEGASGINLAAVQFFILHHATKKCFAVVHPLHIHEDSPYVHDEVHHLIRVEKRDTQEKVILVENICEKVLFLNGNKDCACIARLPNLYGLCS